jgi:hypothetical protein
MIYYTIYRNYIDIYNNTILQFMDYDPPCKECLVKIMCMNTQYNNPNSVYEYLCLKIKRCNKLINFVLYDKNFDTLDD